MATVDLQSVTSNLLKLDSSPVKLDSSPMNHASAVIDDLESADRQSEEVRGADSWLFIRIFALLHIALSCVHAVQSMLIIHFCTR